MSQVELGISGTEADTDHNQSNTSDSLDAKENLAVKRLVAKLKDVIVVLASSAALSIIVFIASVPIVIAFDLPEPQGPPFYIWPVPFLTMLFYPALSKKLIGETVGKKESGLTVVGADGQPASLGLVFKRSLFHFPLYLIPLVFSIPFLQFAELRATLLYSSLLALPVYFVVVQSIMASFGQRMTLRDRLSGSKVVKAQS